MTELKFTLFEWQKHSQKSPGVPHYQQLLDFIDLQAQASETTCTTQKKKPGFDQHLRRPCGRVASFATNADSVDNNCVVCKTKRYPLYICAKFKLLSPGDKMSVPKDNRLCMNCLTSGHYQRQCKSVHKCKLCQKPYHTLLHAETRSNSVTTSKGLKLPLKCHPMRP